MSPAWTHHRLFDCRQAQMGRYAGKTSIRRAKTSRNGGGWRRQDGGEKKSEFCFWHLQFLASSEFRQCCTSIIHQNPPESMDASVHTEAGAACQAADSLKHARHAKKRDRQLRFSIEPFTDLAKVA
jgi:hypothetical protein